MVDKILQSMIVPKRTCRPTHNNLHFFRTIHFTKIGICIVSFIAECYQVKLMLFERFDKSTNLYTLFFIAFREDLMVRF